MTLYYGAELRHADGVCLGYLTQHAGVRLVAAKRELTAAIEALRPSDQFAVLVFDNTVRMWQKKLVAANPVNKKSAIAFVNRQETNLMTASYDAEAGWRSTPRRSSF